MKEIITTNPQWIVLLAKTYKDKIPVKLVDDAGIGIDPLSQTLLQMGMKARLGVQGWSAVAVSMGVAGLGVYLTVMAILDPEPFSKVGLSIVSGAVLTLSGGFSAIRILTKTKPPNVAVGPGGFIIKWE